MPELDEPIDCCICGKTYDNTDYVDVFRKMDGTYICERCIKSALKEDSKKKRW
jgi:hypothetical protein